jgi:hypothetical protein
VRRRGRGRDRADQIELPDQSPRNYFNIDK